MGLVESVRKFLFNRFLKRHEQKSSTQSHVLNWSKIATVGVVYRIDQEQDLKRFHSFIKSIGKNRVVDFLLVQAERKSLTESNNEKLLTVEDFTWAQYPKQTEHEFFAKKYDLLLASGFPFDRHLISCSALSKAKIKISNQTQFPDSFDLIVSDDTNGVDSLQTQIDVLQALSPHTSSSPVLA